METVDLRSLNLAFPEETLALERISSANATPLLKRRAPSLPLDCADPLNALPTDINDSTVKTLTGALEASYKLLWSKVQLVEPPRTLDDVRRLISRPFVADEQTETSPKEKSDTPTPLGKLIVGTAADHKTGSDDSARGNLLYSPPHCD